MLASAPKKILSGPLYTFKNFPYNPNLRTLGDMFAGGGGTTTGVVNVPGVKVIWAINHSEKAIASHAANHPETVHYREDIVTMDISKLAKVDALWASLECFPAGTLILTANGQKPIEELTTNDYVLTHTGSWKRVTSTMSKMADTIIIRGQGHPGLETTAEHPLYVRRNNYIWNNDKRHYFNHPLPPAWVKAADTVYTKTKHQHHDKNYRWATPVSFQPLPIPEVPGKGVNMESLEFWWLVGRWLGDGLSAPNRGGQISIVCGKHEVAMLKEKLSYWATLDQRAGYNKLTWRNRQLRTAAIFFCSYLGLSTWLIEHFGKLAHGKKIPSWALSMKPEFKKALIEGYVSADGYTNDKRKEITTVSKSLAIGIRLLVESLGYRTSLYCEASHNSVIEGRKVNVRDQWRVMWFNNQSQRKGFQDEKHAWTSIKKHVVGNKSVKVYNISVEEDESYIADGIVVHNCTHFSGAKGGQARNADSRMLAEQMYRYIAHCTPNYVFIENVVEFINWSELVQKKDKFGNLVFKENGEPYMIPDVDKDKQGTLYKQWVATIKSMGYEYRYKVLNAADFGAYTSRSRYFAIFAKTGLPIRFPNATHHKKGQKAGLLPWKAVREKLDFSDKGNSIFGRKKDLSEKTLARIYAGLQKYVAKGEENFIAKYYSGKPEGKVTSTFSPLGTITTADRMGLIQPEPFILKWNSNNAKTGINNGNSVNDPLATITTQNRLGICQAEAALPKENFIVQRNGGNPDSKVISTERPARTLTTTGGNQDLVQVVRQESFLLNYGMKGLQTVDKPAGTITTHERMGLVVPSFIMSQYSGGGSSSSLTRPCPAITTVPKHNLIQPFIVEQYGNQTIKSVDQPAGSITCNPKHNMVQAEKNPWLMAGQFNNVGQDLEKPHPTITASHHQTYLMRSVVGTPIELKESDSPMLSKIKEFCFQHGIGDVYMRMLRVDELLQIQGFPADYLLLGSNKDKKKFIGNSVCPIMSQVLVAANVCANIEVNCVQENYACA